MMKYLFLLFFGIALGVGGCYAAYNLHVVRTSDEHICLWKQSPELSIVYVDVREWNARDWADHPSLTKAMVDAGYGDLVIKEASGGVLGDLFRLGGAALGVEQEATRQ
ncbi:hypothetical protein [Calycomorphotria hydatis]|uniref:Uncharacterized protein n=1 Tax=Calycomorphotria hydatis TaxID=2528027 RepID=A0A517T7L3_9PLAN|nr:hypothetical protein [Calycomorphotria hydatis]QDT64364.1 hypothetical protein V22_15980 [Calycomorphotria hydatis]